MKNSKFIGKNDQKKWNKIPRIPLFWTIFELLILLIFICACPCVSVSVCMCVCVHVCTCMLTSILQHVWTDQRTTSESRLFRSTTWGSGMEVRLAGSAITNWCISPPPESQGLVGEDDVKHVPFLKVVCHLNQFPASEPNVSWFN